MNVAKKQKLAANKISQKHLHLRRKSMIISDLNYLENTSEEVFGGRGTNINNIFTSDKVVKAVVDESYTKSVTTNLGGLTGSTSELVVSSDASGKSTFTSVIGGVQTEEGRSETFVNAISVSSGH
jgi:hypothetical protein